MRSTAQRVLLASGFGGLLFFATFIVLGVVTPSYDSLHQTISALEFTASADLQRLNFLVFGLLGMTFAVALFRELQGGRGAIAIPLFQLLAGVGVVGDAIYIHEPLHTACDLVAFNSSLLVLFLFAWRFRRDPRWKGWASYSVGTAILMMAFLTAFGFALHQGGPAGLFEKLATLTRTLWSVALVLALYGGRPLKQPVHA